MTNSGTNDNYSGGAIKLSIDFGSCDDDDDHDNDNESPGNDDSVKTKASSVKVSIVPPVSARAAEHIYAHGVKSAHPISGSLFRTVDLSIPEDVFKRLLELDSIFDMSYLIDGLHSTESITDLFTKRINATASLKYQKINKNISLHGIEYFFEILVPLMFTDKEMLRKISGICDFIKTCYVNYQPVSACNFSDLKSLDSVLKDYQLYKNGALPNDFNLLLSEINVKMFQSHSFWDVICSEADRMSQYFERMEYLDKYDVVCDGVVIEMSQEFNRFFMNYNDGSCKQGSSSDIDSFNFVTEAPFGKLLE